MRRIAFIVVMLGMLVLVGLMIFNIREVKDLEGLEINQKVSLSGKVISERVIYSDEKILMLDKNISLICSGCGSYLNSEIMVEGVVEEYEGEKQVRVLKVLK